MSGIPFKQLNSAHTKVFTIMCKAFDWKHSRISMLEEETIPQSCIPYAQTGLSIASYKRSSLLVVNSDLHLSNQHIFRRVFTSYFRFMEMCLCQVSPEILYV
jgi:hypothetical protein